MTEHPNATVTFVIESRAEYLLICRAPHESNFPGLWAFPGGKVEIGETAIQTVVREVSEETGLTLLDEAAFLDSYYFKRTVGFAFLVRAKTRQLALANEIIDHRWVRGLADLQSLPCIPGIHNHLARALEITKAGHWDRLSRMNLSPDVYLNR